MKNDVIGRFGAFGSLTLCIFWLVVIGMGSAETGVSAGVIWIGMISFFSTSDFSTRRARANPKRSIPLEIRANALRT